MDFFREFRTDSIFRTADRFRPFFKLVNDIRSRQAPAQAYIHFLISLYVRTAN